ncbi:hypothetical protein BCV71DRAFT_216301 [Rhizopus microsporus]|uniref:Uncharacterized protein n=1 Tax=Rhizopus microsporus TaxID=58291 RepID=A0A1X0S042_RHIZD|nr:hypothetical protein BCV71DRAFT_216301 [Rhizopus microsporus]
MTTAYKMDLTYNSQCRMMKMDSFRFINDNSDNILSLPVIIEKLNQVKAIIERIMDSLYRRVAEGKKGEDITMYIRWPCENPVATKIIE